MIKNKIEYHFLKRAIEKFGQDLNKINLIISNQAFSNDDLLDLMHDLVEVKEVIESLEEIYSEKRIFLKNYSF
ncbi:MAG: hypothetical protein ACJA0S_000278 [Rickettsiales bacterium]|jgi:hypothetical protein